MNNKKFIAFTSAAIVFSIMLCCGCSDKDDKDNNNSDVAGMSDIATFEDFKFLMYTDSNGEHVVKAEDGTQLQPDSEGKYYYEGVEVEIYGAGDKKTLEYKDDAELSIATPGTSDTMAYLFDNDNSSSGSTDEKDGGDEDGSTEDNDNEEPATEVPDKIDNSEEFNWGDNFDSIAKDENPNYSSGNHWYTKATNSSQYNPYSGDEKASQGSTIVAGNTIGDNIINTVKINTLTKGDGYVAVNVTYNLNLDEYQQYMVDTYGDVQIDAEGNEVPANYKQVAIDGILSTNISCIKGIDTIKGEGYDIAFDETGTVTLDMAVSVEDSAENNYVLDVGGVLIALE